ncbi:glycoside hydrolase superfamily [Aspergillus heterothallicus]
MALALSHSPRSSRSGSTRWLDITDLNPCPLNACCNIWGQYSITPSFCINTNTGAPGTAKPGTYGCISNCGMDVVKGDVNGSIRLAYYQGYCFNRECLCQDAAQIDTLKYTHLHFGFSLMNVNYDVNEFKRLHGVKWILVKLENRVAMASKITNFIKEHNLNSVNINWEYPGAPDFPEFDPGSKEDGLNYLAFLIILKNLLPGKSITITAPASYYQVNLTKTRQSSAMIIKAGVPGSKVLVGVSSYGWSFKIANAGCWGPDYLYIRDRLGSQAKKGKCTATSSYITNIEIAEILSDPSHVNRHFVNLSSNSDILVYNNTE